MAFNNPFSNRVVRTLFYDYAEPKVGSILYVKLIGVPFQMFGSPEHTGIYIGNNQVVELHGSGEIRCVSMSKFLYGDSLFVRMGINVYVITNKKGKVLCSTLAAERAKKKVGSKIDYNLVMNNCHMFTSYCLTGNENNNDSTFLQLQWKIAEHFVISKVDWRVCKID